MKNAWPKWTTDLTQKFVPGEDQLGLEAAAQGYQQFLAPGIISTTDRARYYSFYAWVLSRYWHQQDRSGLLKDYRQTFFRPHEVALIAGAYNHHQGGKPLAGLVGAGNHASTARKIWNTGPAIGLDFAYFKNPLGGFGQYYLGAMLVMDLIAQPERAGVAYSLTPQGEALAQAYEHSLAGTHYLRELQVHGVLKQLDRDGAAAYGERGCICAEALARGEDRELLRRAFFRLDVDDPASPHVRRRQTLGVALDMVHQAEGRLREQTLRSALYLGDYRPAPELADWAERWQMVEIRHMYSCGLQALWAAFLLQLSDADGGLTLPELRAWLKENPLADEYDRPVVGFLDGLCRDFGLVDDWQVANAQFDTACRQETGSDEYTLFDSARSRSGDANVLVAFGLQVLAQLFLRFLPRHRANDCLWQELDKRQQPRLPLTGFFDAMLRHLEDPSWTAGQWLNWLYVDYILGQHQAVALEKLRTQQYDTFKFYYRDGRFIWPFSAPGVYREPIRLAWLRLTNVLRILADLGLVVTDDQGQMSLTVDGQYYRQAVLQRGDHETR